MRSLKERRQVAISRLQSELTKLMDGPKLVPVHYFMMELAYNPPAIVLSLPSCDTLVGRHLAIDEVDVVTNQVSLLHQHPREKV